MSKHTRTPWRIFTTTDGRKLVGIGAKNGQGILDCGFGVWAWDDAEGIANAHLVVTAVNAFDDMKAALIDALRSTRKDFKAGPDGDRQHREAYAEQFAALTKAQGQPSVSGGEEG